MTGEDLEAAIEERDCLAERVCHLEDLLTEIKLVDDERNARHLDAIDEIVYQANLMDAIVHGHDNDTVRHPVRGGGLAAVTS